VIKECHNIAKESVLLPEALKQQVASFYKEFKYSEAGIKQYFKEKLNSIDETASLIEKMVAKIPMLSKLPKEIKDQTISMIEEDIVERISKAKENEVGVLFWFIVNILHIDSERLIELIFRFYHQINRKT